LYGDEDEHLDKDGGAEGSDEIEGDFKEGDDCEDGCDVDGEFAC
jgi:hypothetical protein